MKTLLLNKTRIAALTFYALLSFGLLCNQSAAAVPAQDKTAPAETEKAVTDQSEEADTFEYLIEGRPDPFQPFITKESTSANLDEIVPVTEELTGMQLFEPGQLTLVAVVLSDTDDFAMAEDFTGKGYVLKKDMKIGKRGVVTAITTNQVVIEETSQTRAGKTIKSKIVMLLKKEGEE